MQLHRLKLINFRQHADTEIEFGSGLTAVIGPNGAGKTTLLEAIGWALYGQDAARGKKDSIRWNRAPARSQVKVVLDFSLGAHEYRVSRGMNDAELFLDRGNTPVSSGTSEVTAKLTQLLRMSRKEFFSTYFTGQKDLAVMSALQGPAERGRFLSQVLGYEKLRGAQDLIRAVRGQRRGELTGLELGLGDQAELERELKQASERKAETARMVQRAEETKAREAQALAVEGPEWTRVAEMRQRVASLDSDRRAAEHEVIDARRDHERLDRDLAAALDARSKLEELAPAFAEVEPLRAELERLDQEGRAAGQRRDLAGELREVDAQAGRGRERLAALGDTAATLAAREADLKTAKGMVTKHAAEEDKARTGWVQEKERANAKRDELLDQYKDVKEQRDKVVELGPKGLCPTCGREMGKDFETLVGKFDRQMEELVANGQYFKSRISQLEAEPKELQEAVKARAAATALAGKATEMVAEARAAVRERADMEKSQKTLDTRVAQLKQKIAELPEKYDAERHDVVRDRLKELEPLVRHRERLTVESERAAALVSEFESAEKRLTEREARARDLTAAIADLGYSEEHYLAVRARHERADSALRQADLDLVAQRGDLKGAEVAHLQAQKRVEERALRGTRITDLQTEVRLHDELDTAFGEIRTDLNAQMRPELSDIASSLLADITDGRYTELELDENYGIVLMEDGMARPVPSGGEEDVANLVLRLAISQLVADRAGQPLSLLVLDEIFGSLDESRREHVVSLLRGLADRFPQVVLITHIEQVRDRVDRVLRVRLDETKGSAVVTEDAVEVRSA